MKYLLLSLFILTSCSNSKGTSALSFSDSVEVKKEELSHREALEIEKKKAQEEAKAKFLEDKKVTWVEINEDAKETFKAVSPILENKCYSCHDANTKLPLYGKIFKGINPVSKHQVEGLKALDLSKGFPFQAQGNPPTVSLLKSIKNAFIEKTMPIKAYTFFYPHKKITAEDQKALIDWIDPVIQNFEEYEVNFNTVQETTDVTVQATKILEMKCYQCHANSNHRGSFGDMENTAALLKSKYINLDKPEDSKLFASVATFKMPPSKLDKLTVDELNTVRDWLDSEAKKMDLQKK